MIRRGDEIRLGPLRVLIAHVTNGICEVHVAYKDQSIGSSLAVDEKVLENLDKEAREYVEDFEEAQEWAERYDDLLSACGGTFPT